MGLLGSITDTMVTQLLKGLKDSLLKDTLDGIGKITDVSYKNKQLQLSVILDGLEDHEIKAEARKIRIGEGGSSIALSDFTSNMPFVSTLLNRYMAGKDIPLPEGPVRTAAKQAKSLLGL